MFSWSSARQKTNGTTSTSTSTSTSTLTSNYPAHRVTPVAQTIQGSIRAPEYTRTQHLESYLNDEVLKRSTRRVSTDDSTYDTVFQTTTGAALILRVQLPLPSFRGAPCCAPSMTLVGVRATHPWLDTRMRVVGYAHARNDDTWRDSRLSLGAAVHEVVKHLQLNPPQILEITDVGLQRIQQNPGPSQITTNTPQQIRACITSDAPPNYGSLLDTPDVDTPSIPSNYPELDSLRRDELQLLLDNEIDFLQFVAKLDAHAEIQFMGTSALVENTKMAKANLDKEFEITLMHNDVTKLQTQLKHKLSTYKELENQQNSKCAPLDQRMIIRELTKAKKAAMDDSDTYAEHFVENGGNVADFVKEFLARRRHYHIRAAKIELLQNTTL